MAAYIDCTVTPGGHALFREGVLCFGRMCSISEGPALFREGALYFGRVCSISGGCALFLTAVIIVSREEADADEPLHVTADLWHVLEMRPVFKAPMAITI